MDEKEMTGDQPVDSSLASETLARLYEEQGDLTRASTIREKLMEPGDWEIEVRSSGPSGASAVDSVSLETVSATEVRCDWSITAEAMKQAKRSFPLSLKEHSKALTPVLRVVSARPGGQTATRRVSDLELPGMAGDCLVRSVAKGPQWMCAAAGLKHASGRFHPTAHSEVLAVHES